MYTIIFKIGCKFINSNSIPGYYVYTESSAPATTGDKAHLISKPFTTSPENSDHCLTFFYSMHGLGIGALRVFLVHQGTGTERELWEKTGPQGEGWKEAEVDFSSTSEYKVWCNLFQIQRRI